jgi:two-component system chemotaxis sensor kinase CheA
MNEFLKQFLVESREFVEQASEGLLRLERSPDHAELLDAVFRAFHTLKGGAGIVEFPAMERAVHAAENILSDARSGRHALTALRVGNCLGCLDQVVKWLDTIEQSGELPTDAEAAADIIVGRSEAAAGGAPATAAPSGIAEPEWVTNLLRQHTLLAAPPAAAVRFVPDFDCFFNGEDPVARMTALPQLLAMDLEPVSAWPKLNALDVYRCNLVLTALTGAAASDLNLHMKGCSGEYEIVLIDAAPASDRQPALPIRACEVLAEQAKSLAGTQSHNFIGRVTAAGLTAANVLRFCRRPNQARLIAGITDQCLVDNSPQSLQDAIARILEEPSAAIPEAAVARDAPQRAESGSRTVRVAAERIDALVRLTSELTVAKNAVGHLAKMARAQGNSLAGELKDCHGTLEHLVRDLQKAVLGMRVLPLRSVLQRFPRIVRELSASQGKPLRLEIEGDETEADKAIVEMLFEPLLHVVRNAVDHGVESAPLRAQRGKAAIATLNMRAARHGDQVLIEIRDDGGGVDVERVRQVARERGLVSEDVLRTMSEVEVVALIFAPGFSTATKLSALSGRGVGMDAVRTAVERIGGRVSIDSRPGLGTAIRILLPFSVMMTRVMTIEAGKQIFGIPLDAIVETVRVAPDALADLGAAQALVLRGRTIPIVELDRTLGIAHASRAANQATVVITASAGQWVGIRVDQLGEQMEVILHPLDGLLSGIPGIAGTTLLGDGRVLLVLDIGALLQ